MTTPHVALNCLANYPLSGNQFDNSAPQFVVFAKINNKKGDNSAGSAGYSSAERSVLRSSSSKTFRTGGKSSPNICTGGKSSPNICNKFAAAISYMISSIFNVDEFRCDICINNPPKNHAHLQSRFWPSPSWLCGARECSMISTIVKLLLAQPFCITNQLACVSRCLPQITFLISLALGAV